jgi:hypothetical protein
MVATQSDDKAYDENCDVDKPLGKGIAAAMNFMQAVPAPAHAGLQRQVGLACDTWEVRSLCTCRIM